MPTSLLSIDPEAPCWEEIRLTDAIAVSYSLDEWAAGFDLMTAGYRERMDGDDANKPGFRFNLLTVAIFVEAKARVFKRQLPVGEAGDVHLGGEVRPHTQEFIRLSARIYAAHGFRVHLRQDIATTPIWYSSFGIAYLEHQSGDNYTASHSYCLKGGWKPLDGEGKQLLGEEEDIVSEVRAIVSERQTIQLAPWQPNELIHSDFDVDRAYTDYQTSVLGREMIDRVVAAGRKGFRCAICTLGGSMKGTSERIFHLLGISTGADGIVRYVLGDEDEHYHGVGGEDGSVDPGKAQVYRSRQVGAREALLSGSAQLFIIWDPDGDRVKVMGVAPLEEAPIARQNGLEVDEESAVGKCVVYFDPNQLYVLLAGFRLDLLRQSGDLTSADWFVAASFPTTQALAELCAASGIPCVRVPVGFKHIGDLCREVEGQLGKDASFETVTGERLALGLKPRALLLCEESGGATFGGEGLFTSKAGGRRMLALREKDGMQVGLLALAVAGTLHAQGRSLIAYYDELVSRHGLRFLHYRRTDVRLYDETLRDVDALEAAKAEGLQLRDRVVAFYQELLEDHVAGRRSLGDVRDAINARRGSGEAPMPVLTRVAATGDGILMESESLRFILRASGTDALLRYYVESTDRETLEAAGSMLVGLRID